jgi:hypothetical protein
VSQVNHFFLGQPVMSNLAGKRDGAHAPLVHPSPCAGAGTARKKRAQRLRSDARKVEWLLSLRQAQESHHTAPHRGIATTAERLHKLESQVERLLVEVAKLGVLPAECGVVEEGTFEHDGLSRDAINVAAPMGEEGTFEDDGLTCPVVRGVVPAVSALLEVSVDVGCATPMATTPLAKLSAPRAFVGGMAEGGRQSLENEGEVERMQAVELENDLKHLRTSRSACEKTVVMLRDPASLPGGRKDWDDMRVQRAMLNARRQHAQVQHDISVILQLLGRADEPRPGIKFGPDRL